MSISKRQWEEWEAQTKERAPVPEPEPIIWREEYAKREKRKAYWRVASTAGIVVGIVLFFLAVIVVAGQIIQRYAP
jgi:hypothetical protein